MATLRLRSGLRIEDVEQRLDDFLAAEWAYYDAFLDDTPNEITALDVLAPVTMNAYAFRGGAANLRLIHQGLSDACDPLLPSIPVDADLRSFDPELEMIRELLHAAVSVKQVLVPVATKVLFRKRREMIAMLDNVVLSYYFDALGRSELLGRSQEKSRAADVAVTVLRVFRDDLIEAYPVASELSDRSMAQGRPIGPLRTLEVLLWCQVEPRGYYRAS